MKSTQKKHSRSASTSTLKKGKGKSVSWIEKLCLKYAGRCDGKRGLPREQEDGSWTSPLIERELRGYDEFASYLFGQLQIAEEADYAELEKKADAVMHLREKLESAEAELDAAIRMDMPEDACCRKTGEANLTDEQVVSRRAREREKHLEPARSKVRSIRAELSDEIRAFSELRSKLLERDNSARMICRRVMDHLYQRILIYWDAALQKHPDSKEIPVLPCVKADDRSEAAYKQPHLLLLHRAEEIFQSVQQDEKEAA